MALPTIKTVTASDAAPAIDVVILTVSADPAARWAYPDPQQYLRYSSALLQHALLQCDRDNKLAYLESTNPKSIPLYERHGFEVLGTIQVEASPPIFPMLRKPP